MNGKLSPAVRRAAAFVYLTGSRPAHIRHATAAALWEIAPYVPGAREVCGVRIGEYQIAAERLADVRADPLAVAGDWFRERGFKVETPTGRARTTHYVAFRRDSGAMAADSVHYWEGTAYRGGGGSLTAIHAKEHGAPYRTSWQLAALGDAWPALLRPGCYVGERPAGEHPRAYLERALAAYRSA